MSITNCTSSIGVVQNAESEIETMLPNELLRRVFSFLPYQSISHAYCVSTRWKLLSFDYVRMHESKCFKSLIEGIVANLEDKHIKTREKIAALISDKPLISLQQIKVTHQTSEEQLVLFLKELDEQKLNQLEALCGDKPLHFKKLFTDVKHYQSMRTLACLIYYR